MPANRCLVPYAFIDVCFSLHPRSSHRFAEGDDWLYASSPGLCQGQGLVVCGVPCCRMLCCIMRLAAQRRSGRRVFDCCQCQYPCGGSSFLGGFGCLCFFFFGGFGGLWLTCLGCGPCGGRVVTHDVVPKPMNSAIVAIIIVFLMVKVFVS